MLYTIENEALSYSLNERGAVVSIVNKLTGHEYCAAPGELFRVVCSYEDYLERTIDAEGQDAPEITVDGAEMTVRWPHLLLENRRLDVSLLFRFFFDRYGLNVTCEIQNDAEVTVPEIQITAFAGIHALSGNCAKDTLLVPRRLGHRIPVPARADFFKHSIQFKRKYERPDQRHSDFDVPYPGFGCMQWFSLYNEQEAIYVANHDTEQRIICLHTERRVSDDTLRLGVAHYPFLEKGESYTTPRGVYAPLQGDWHGCARLYRRFMNEAAGWRAPELPDWAKDFNGWLRVIFRTQSGEYNYHFSDIPRMFDELQKTGLNTLFLLGWPKGGFGRLRPDYFVDEKYADDLRRGVDYVHSKGGKVIFYVSYHAVDRMSRYYREEGGDDTLIRDFYGDYVRYSETYSVDATYRKILNNPRSQYCTCSGSDKWHEKMKKSADDCIALGADGVLYDLGGTKPLLCFSDGHDHKKPNTSRASKSRRYKELRENIKEKGAEHIILQEHCIDVYARHMDIVQPPVFNARDLSCPEMFRYTFPEVRMTNRNMAMDEDRMYDNINYSFIYNLAYDLSIFRCCGTLRDIPHYAEYLTKIVALRKQYPAYFRDGTFCDEDGFKKSKPVFRQKAYRAKDGRLALAVWNDGDKTDTVEYTSLDSGKTVGLTLEKDAVAVVEL